MATRVVALLEPVVGPDRVRVNVALKLDPQSTEETEEQWDPETVIRSKQTSTDVATSGALPMIVAGSRGNIPPSGDGKGVPSGAQAPVTATVPGSSRQSETTNYELSRRTRHVIQPRGDVTRVSVAVILDHDQTLSSGADGGTKVTRVARTPEELAKIQAIVAAAVGLDPERGDQLTVENVPFDEPVVEDAPAPTALQRFAPQIRELGRVGAVLGLALAAFLLVIRPAMRQFGLLGNTPASKTAAPETSDAPAALPIAAGSAPRTVAELESEIEKQLDAAAHQRISVSRKVPVLTRKVATISKDEPEQVALLLRAWMTEESR